MSGPGATPADPTLRAAAKLATVLGRVTGPAGWVALATRALALARAEAPWLAGVRVGADGGLTGFAAGAPPPDPAAAAGGEAFLTEVLALLDTFIGDGLTLHLPQTTWPEVRFGDTLGDPEETH